MDSRRPLRSAWLFGVCALIVATAWFAGSFLEAMMELPEGARGEAASTANVEGPEPAAPGLDPGSRSDRVVSPTPKTEATDVPPEGSGTLEVALVDEETGDPLTGHPYRVFREQDGLVLLTDGITDTEGRGKALHLDPLPYFIETERRPPYAATVGAIEVHAGEVSKLELRIGRGGVVTGRVIDDTGAAVADLPLGLSNASRGRRDLAEDPYTREEVTRTDAEGRYRIEALSNSTRGLEWIDGASSVSVREPVEITALAQGPRPSVRVAVADGEEVQAEDLVVMAFRHWQGTVVDGDGRPVAGALVSLLRERRGDPGGGSGEEPGVGKVDPWALAPADAGFELHPPGECLSDANGHFVISQRSEHPPWILARSADGLAKGSLMSFGLPRLRPGEHSEDLRIELRGSTALTLEFEVAGASADIRAALEDCPGTEAFGRSLRNWDATTSTARFDAGDWSWAKVEVDGETGTTASWSVRTRAWNIRALEVRVPGYRRADVHFPEPPTAGDRIRVPLEPWLRAEVHAEDSDGVLAEGERCPVYLRLTYVRPTEEAPMAHAELGSGCTVQLGPEGCEARLIATVPGRYWITAHATHVPDAHRIFGPFVTGTGPHSLPLDSEFVTACATPAKTIPAPPSSTVPEVAERDEEPSAHVTLAARDAETGKSVLEYSASFLGTAGPAQGRHLGGSARSGTIQRELPPGSYELKLRARGYLPQQTHTFEAIEGQLTDLGTFELEPAPRYRGRIVDAHGRPVPEHTGLYVFDPIGDRRTGLPLEADGSFELVGDLPDALTLHVCGDRVRPDTDGPGAQQLSSTPWTPDEVREFRLAPWRDLELWIHGHAPEHRELGVQVTFDWIDLEPLPDPPMGRWPGQIVDGSPGSRATWSEDIHDVLDWRGDGIRIVPFASAPTRIRIEVTSPLLDYDPLEFDVEAGEGVQKIEVWPR